MTANGTAAYGTYPRNVALTDVVYTLNREGFDNKDICMVLSPIHPVAAVVRDARIVSAEREETALGARAIGWFSEFGAVVIPTVGFFIRSQAFFQALVVEQNSSTLCGGSRTLGGLGFSEDEARRLDYQLGEVGALVYVACSERARADRALEVLRRTGARETASLPRAQTLGAAA